MKHLLPSGTATWRLNLRQQIQNLPLQEWKANITNYLRSVPWPQWGFVLIASFGFLIYLFLAFWLSVLYLLLALFFHLTLGMEISESRQKENSLLGMVVRGIEWFFVEIVRRVLPRKVWVGTEKRLRAAHIHKIMIRGAFALARPNSFTFALGCAGLTLVAISFVQSHLHLASDNAPNIPPYDAGDLNPEPSYPPIDRPDPTRGGNDYD